MNTTRQIMDVSSEAALEQVASALSRQIETPFLIELIGDVGAGKTTFTQYLAAALGVQEPVQSPTFNISRRYPIAGDRELVHYDFYRLGEAGILADELIETLNDPQNLTVIEWASTINAPLPPERLTIEIWPISEYARDLVLTAHGERAQAVLASLNLPYMQQEQL